MSGDESFHAFTVEDVDDVVVRAAVTGEVVEDKTISGIGGPVIIIEHGELITMISADSPASLVAGCGQGCIDKTVLSFFANPSYEGFVAYGLDVNKVYGSLGAEIPVPTTRIDDVSIWKDGVMISKVLWSAASDSAHIAFNAGDLYLEYPGLGAEIEVKISISGNAVNKTAQFSVSGLEGIGSTSSSLIIAEEVEGFPLYF